MNHFGRIRSCLVALEIALTSVRAHSQPDPSTGQNNEQMTLPRLIHASPAAWPSEETPRSGVSVVLEITIDEQGQISQPDVVVSAGEAFDRAALEGVRQLTFEPARRGATPVRVRLRYRYDFPNPSDPAPSQNVTTHAADSQQSASTSPNNNPAPTASAASRSGTELPKLKDTQKPPEDEPLSDESYSAVAEIAAPVREVTRHRIEQQDLTKIPGTSGDALRAIEVMPGVARTSISSGDPILRGAAWNESRAYIEGTTVPLLYHLGGVKSAFNSRLLSRIDLYPGNYGTSYGRGVGGVVSAKVRDPARDRLHALAELSVIDSSALLEMPLGANAAVAVAGRRSNVGLFYDAFAPKSSFSVAAVPTYYDYQGLGWIRLSRHHELRIMAYGSQDSIRLLFANPSDFDPAIRDRADFSMGYRRVQTSLDSTLSSRVKQHLQLTYGYTHMRQILGGANAELSENDLFSRGEWNFRVSNRARINIGYDFEFLNLSGYYVGNRPPQAEGEANNGGASGEKLIDMSDLDTIRAFRPGAYTEIELNPTKSLLLIPGIRIDRYSDQGAWTLDPRLSARYELSERLSVKWGLGVYSQNPQYYELLPKLGNPNLKPYHAQQYSAGFEHRPTDTLSWGLEGFYKRLSNRVVSTPGGQSPYFLNYGVGKIYGIELFARYAGERLNGWLAYTLSRSERQDRTDPWRLFEADQTHILALTANYRLGRGWEAGARFRLTSGNPYTPVVYAVFDVNSGVYQPLNAAPYSARNPMFQQLDLRIEKLWDLGRVRLAGYLDVQNVYNAKNYEGFDYSYDYQQRQRIAGLPLLPNLGLRGEL